MRGNRNQMASHVLSQSKLLNKYHTNYPHWSISWGNHGWLNWFFMWLHHVTVLSIICIISIIPWYLSKGCLIYNSRGLWKFSTHNIVPLVIFSFLAIVRCDCIFMKFEIWPLKEYYMTWVLHPCIAWCDCIRPFSHDYPLMPHPAHIRNCCHPWSEP